MVGVKIDRLNRMSSHVLVLMGVKAPGEGAGVVIAMANLGPWQQLLGGQKGKLATGLSMAG